MENTTAFTGRRIGKTFTLPIDLVELIEQRARETGSEHSRIAESLLVMGLQFEIEHQLPPPEAA